MRGGPELTVGPTAEPERLAAVKRHEILDGPADGVFDRLTALAARHFRVPIAIVSVVDTDRIWFKSKHGLDVDEIGRDPGLCASAIMQTDPWVVTDAAADPRTLANPLVAGEMGLRFYAGVPLTTHDGYNLGTFCVIDQSPREVTVDELEVLRALAATVVDHLELRLQARRAIEHEHALRADAEQMARRLQKALLPPVLPIVTGADVAVRWEPALGGDVGGDFYDLFPSGDDEWSLVVGDVCGKGVDAAAVTALARYTLRAAALQTNNPCEALGLLNDALLRQRPDDERFVTAVFATARMDDSGMAVTWCSAGHVAPLLRRADGTVETVGSQGMPVGLFEDPQLSQTDVELRPGDALFLYTDGVTEARRGRDEFGVERLCEVVAATAGMSAEESVTFIDAQLADFREGLVADDTAVLVLALPA